MEKAFNSVLSDVCTEEIKESNTDDKRAIYQKENRLRQDERKAVFNSMENSDTADRVSFSLTDDLIEAGDGLTHIINPLSFDAQTFGMMPLFLKSVMSGTLLGSCGTLFTQLGSPKNRISCFYEGKGLSTVMCTLYEQSEWHNRLGVRIAQYRITQFVLGDHLVYN